MGFPLCHVARSCSLDLNASTNCRWRYSTTLRSIVRLRRCFPRHCSLWRGLSRTYRVSDSLARIGNVRLLGRRLCLLRRLPLYRFTVLVDVTVARLCNQLRCVDLYFDRSALTVLCCCSRVISQTVLPRKFLGNPRKSLSDSKHRVATVEPSTRRV